MGIGMREWNENGRNGADAGPHLFVGHSLIHFSRSRTHAQSHWRRWMMVFIRPKRTRGATLGGMALQLHG